jgi:putative membrane protein
VSHITPAVEGTPKLRQILDLQEVFVQRESWRYIAIVAASVSLTTLGSCKGRQSSETASGGPQATRTDTAEAPAAAPAGGLTDPNIVALLDEANAADSAAGAYALTKATDPGVKAFAKLMMGEHHALRAAGQQLAQRLNLTPEPPAEDPLKPAAESEMTVLRAAPKGPQFDRTYIEQEIGIHKAVLDVAEKGHDAAQNEDLKKLIEQAKPVIQKHLDRAEEIQKKLGKPTA